MVGESIWLVVEPPLWKIWLCQLRLWNSQYTEKKDSCSKPPTSNHWSSEIPILTWKIWTKHWTIHDNAYEAWWRTAIPPLHGVCCREYDWSQWGYRVRPVFTITKLVQTSWWNLCYFVFSLFLCYGGYITIVFVGFIKHTNQSLGALTL